MSFSISIQRLLKISRPKFWHYSAGPFALAAIPLIHGQLASLVPLILTFFWFLICGNFFIYGINDLSDRDTDAFNNKKNNLDEAKVASQDLQIIKTALVISVVLGLPILAIPVAGVFWLLFLFFAWQYSAKPIRAKSKPFIDGVFNILYILPACVALAFQPTTFLSIISQNYLYLLAGTFWCMAMHAFSAIPDIEADQQAKLTTTAVLLGAPKTLLYCLACYLAGILSLILSSHPLFALLFVPYLIIISFLYTQKTSAVSIFYKHFPKINLLMGAVIFFLILLS